jgi:hypothetical protein
MKTLAEATRQVATKRVLEKDLQKQAVTWMRDRGYWARKFSSQSQRSVPDYLFAQYDWTGVKIKLACEFKRPGCKVSKETGVMSTKAQVEEQEAMRLAGWFVFECDNLDTFKRTVLAYEGELSS